MTLTITVPNGFAYVPAALVSTVWVMVWQYSVVVKHRQLSGIKYPQLYAEKAQMDESREAYIFNCAQRAHQNTLEVLPAILISTLIGSIKYPTISAACCAYWALGRISYTRGYVSGDPKKRGTLLYRSSYIGLFGLIGAATLTAGEYLCAEVCKLL